MKKFLLILTFTFLYFFLFLPNTYAKTSADFMQDKEQYSQEYNSIIYSNLELDEDFFKYSNPVFYFGQRTFNDFLSFSDWSTKYSNGGSLAYRPGSKQTLYADNDNVESFIYGMTFEPVYQFEANKKYEFAFVVSTTDEIDYYSQYEYIDDYYIGSRNGSSEYSTNYKRFYFLKEDDVDASGFVHYWFFFQFEFSDDVYSPHFTLGDSTDAFSDSSIHYLSNYTNKNITLSYAQIRLFEVSDFSDSSGIIHTGGGMTFDGERVDDSTFDEVTGVCDTLDLTCHFNNLKNWFVTLGRRISNAFESLINFFTSFFDNLLSFIRDLFIPDSEELSSVFDTLSTYFNDKLGFLVFPFELIIDFLNKFVNLPNDPVKNITISDISIGSFGTLIHGFTFNIAEYWEKAPFKQIYDIYLLFVHAFIGFGLYKLCLNKYNEIVGGKGK